MKRIILSQENIDYHLGGGLGSWAKSFEKKRPVQGEVRLIDGVLMSAQYIYKRWFKYEINWTPVDSEQNEPEHLREWVRR